MADFIDKLTGGIDKGIKTISSKSKEFIEVTKLRSEIKDIESSIQSRFNSLGKKVFEMLNKGELDQGELASSHEDIKTLFKKIAEIHGNIKRIELETLRVQQGADAVLCPKSSAPINPAI